MTNLIFAGCFEVSMDYRYFKYLSVAMYDLMQKMKRGKYRDENIL